MVVDVSVTIHAHVMRVKGTETHTFIVAAFK